MRKLLWKNIIHINQRSVYNFTPLEKMKLISISCIFYLAKHKEYHILNTHNMHNPVSADEPTSISFSSDINPGKYDSGGYNKYDR